jgi:pimeloyl-ACP methyl ester carboxylesterase
MWSKNSCLMLTPGSCDEPATDWNHAPAVPDRGRDQDPLRRHRRTRGSVDPAHQSVAESVYAFAPIWSSLARHARLFAVDLPGFGRSERRHDLLAPRATSMVVGSGGAAVPIQLGGPLAEWTLDPDFDRFRAMDPRVIVGAALDTIETYTVPPEIREDYLESYAGDRFVESMRYVRSYPDELPRLARLLPEIDTPVLIIAGRRDRAVPVANAEFLDERVPRRRLTVLDTGHFVWEEAADQYASLVADWVTAGYRDAGRSVGSR